MVHRPVFLLAAAVVLIKVSLVIIGQRYVDGDEAVIGVMAIHISKGLDFPIYYWGQPYGGGSAIEAYLSAIPFTIFGPSSLILRLVNLSMALACLVLVFHLVRSLYGESAAILTTVLVASTSGLAQWFSKSRGGYIETSLIMLTVVHVLDKVQRSPNFSYLLPIFVGFICGLAYYVQEIAMPFVLLTSVALIKATWSRRTPKAFASFVVGIGLGVLPVLVYNYQYDSANFKYIFAASQTYELTLTRLRYAFVNKLPFLFQRMNFDSFPSQLPWQTGVEAALWLTLASFSGIQALKRFLKRDGQAFIEAFLAAYLFAFMPYILLSQRAESSPRYYFTLMFPILILASTAIYRGLKQPSQWSRSVCMCICIFLIGSGLWSHAEAYMTNEVADDAWLPDGTVVSLQTNGSDIPRVISYLDQHGIVAVRSPYFSQWRIIFESQESIIASSVGLYPYAARYPDYDRIVAETYQTAFVINCKSRYTSEFGKNYRRKRIGSFCIYRLRD